MKKLKIGIIGCGSIAKHRHMPEYHASSGAVIAAVCDINEGRAKGFADLYEAKAYTDYRELLDDTDIDAVSVCTPNYLHAPISVAALNAGKHVLCEKPMATSMEEAQDMIEAAHKNGKKLMIAHNQRFVPSHKKAKELIARGKREKSTVSGLLLDMAGRRDGVQMAKKAGSSKRIRLLLARWVTLVSIRPTSCVTCWEKSLLRSEHLSKQVPKPVLMSMIQPYAF